MDERSDADKMEELMLPGFRFHPTDEELVGFYLKRKIQQRPLSIELIKQLDIYKYDPWDLPKLATTGEKEWYFYCPRDRKYRNSARPNRVTGAGFWKATGTDRPIYSSEGNSKCIGLKKSLVFYKGRAAKGFKTDWMMHEFRLPSLTDSGPQKRFIDKNIPPNDSWAICRIFKKTNSSVQRAISQSWASPLLETTTTSDVVPTSTTTDRLSSENMSSFTTTQFSCGNDLHKPSITSFSHLDFPPIYKPVSNHELVLDLNPTSYTCTFSDQMPNNQPNKSGAAYASSILLNMSSSVFGDFGKASESVDFNGLQEQCTAAGFTITTATLLPDGIMERDCSNGEDQITAAALMKDPNVAAHFHDDQWGSTIRSVAFPFTTTLASTSSSTNLPHDAWNSSNLVWDSSPCPSEMSTTAYSTNKCYT